MISKKAAAIAPSATLVVDSKAKEFTRAGFKVINFSVGQPDFDTPSHICQVAKKAIDAGFTKYTPSGGIPELKQAIADRFRKDDGLIYRPNQIIVSVGGKQALFNLIFGLIDPGDEVILPTPAWVSYAEQISICGGKPVLVPGRKDYKISADQLQRAITVRTKLLILNSPSNPTGAVYSAKELNQIARVIVRKKIWVLSDEVYGKIVYGNQKHTSIASLGKEIYERTFVVNAVSKTYAMTGWRIGWAAGDAKVIAACDALQSQTTSNACSIAQKAALAALTGPQDFVRQMTSSFARRRKQLVEGLKKIRGLKVDLPQGAFYVWVDIRPIEADSGRFCTRLIEKKKVAAVPGSAFFAEGYIRLSFAVSPADIKEGIDRISAFITEEYGRNKP